MNNQYSNAARRTDFGFTLVEMLISTAVLALLILIVTQVINTAATTVRPANKHIDTDTQARVVLDRMALDFAQMLKRIDVDYYLKGPPNYTGHGNGHAWGKKLQAGQLGDDQIAFFTQVSGYSAGAPTPYPATSQSSVSLVAYRINQSSSTNRAWLRLERMGKGLLWNGVSNSYTPLVFLPVTIGSLWPAAVNNNTNCGGNNTSCDPAYEIIGPDVFRFEYYYLLKNGRATGQPWNTDAGHTSMAGIGLGDVEAIGVVIAVIDPAGRALVDAVSPDRMFDLISDLADFQSAPGRGFGNQQKYVGGLESAWETTVATVASTGYTSSGTYFPPEAAKGIKIYSRTFDLKTLPAF